MKLDKCIMWAIVCPTRGDKYHIVKNTLARTRSGSIIEYEARHTRPWTVSYRKGWRCIQIRLDSMTAVDPRGKVIEAMTLEVDRVNNRMQKLEKALAEYMVLGKGKCTISKQLLDLAIDARKS